MKACEKDRLQNSLPGQYLDVNGLNVSWKQQPNSQNGIKQHQNLTKVLPVGKNSAQQSLHREELPLVSLLTDQNQQVVHGGYLKSATSKQEPLDFNSKNAGNSNKINSTSNVYNQKEMLKERRKQFFNDYYQAADISTQQFSASSQICPSALTTKYQSSCIQDPRNQLQSNENINSQCRGFNKPHYADNTCCTGRDNANLEQVNKLNEFEENTSCKSSDLGIPLSQRKESLKNNQLPKNYVLVTHIRAKEHCGTDGNPVAVPPSSVLLRGIATKAVETSCSNSRKDVCLNSALG